MLDHIAKSFSIQGKEVGYTGAVPRDASYLFNQSCDRLIAAGEGVLLRIPSLALHGVNIAPAG